MTTGLHEFPFTSHLHPSTFRFVFPLSFPFRRLAPFVLGPSLRRNLLAPPLRSPLDFFPGRFVLHLKGVAVAVLQKDDLISLCKGPFSSATIHNCGITDPEAL